MNETLWPEDWQWQEPATAAGTPRLPAPPPAAAPAEAGWSGRGQPKQGTADDNARGVEGRLQLSLGQARRRWRGGGGRHQPAQPLPPRQPGRRQREQPGGVERHGAPAHPARSGAAPGPGGGSAGMAASGRGARQLPRFPAAAGSCSAGVCGAGASAHAGGSPERLGRRAAGRQP